MCERFVVLLVDTWYGGLAFWWLTVGLLLAGPVCDTRWNWNVCERLPSVVEPFLLVLFFASSFAGIVAIFISMYREAWGRAMIQLVMGVASVLAVLMILGWLYPFVS